MFTLSYVEGYVLFVVVVAMAVMGLYLIHVINELEKELDDSKKAYKFMQNEVKKANSQNVLMANVIDLMSERENH